MVIPAERGQMEPTDSRRARSPPRSRDQVQGAPQHLIRARCKYQQYSISLFLNVIVVFFGGNTNLKVDMIQQQVLRRPPGTPSGPKQEIVEPKNNIIQYHILQQPMNYFFYPLQQELFTYNTCKTQQDTPKLIHVPYVRSPFSYSFLVRFESTHR